MSFPVPVTSSAIRVAVGGTATTFSPSLADGEVWVLSTTQALYFAQGSAPTATAGNGSTLLPAGDSVLIDGGIGAKISVIQATAAGEATLTKATFVR